MNDLDLKPNRLELALNLCGQFIHEFYDQNPLSQLGVIVTRDGLAEKISELSGNPTLHLLALKDRTNREMSGEPSLQNAIDLARHSLGHMSHHASKELIIVMGSLTTCDPGNIFETIEMCKKEKIRISTIGLSAETQLAKTMAKETDGILYLFMIRKTCHCYE